MWGPLYALDVQLSLCHLQSDPRASCGLGTACVCPAPTCHVVCAVCTRCLFHVLPVHCVTLRVTGMIFQRPGSPSEPMQDGA